MDRYKFSTIAHQKHVYCNPIPETKMSRLIGLLALQQGQRFVDIGAGHAELSIRLCERYDGVEAVALEWSEPALAAAAARAAKRVGPERLKLIGGDAGEAVAAMEDASCDAALCIGSSQALGNAEAALQAMRRIVRPGGSIVLGEGYWRKPPCSAYLEALDAEEDELKTHAGNVRLGVDLGLEPLWSFTASEDDWDEYEWLYKYSVEQYAMEHPDDPDREAMLERIRSWNSVFIRWGRDTLGFGLYWFRNGSDRN
ncbi:class I SAM-dependent methyltransferase [Paenibacillus koleovorans]|uniref:class I SAM-dependent methyltransferase n=1 Tax=Paenibacillus koleovorans TaxID=121608 RepID=UPI000FDCB49A|nr:methyltransferase domain-containing protein [Paenibacillus koleovorans]